MRHLGEFYPSHLQFPRLPHPPVLNRKSYDGDGEGFQTGADLDCFVGAGAAGRAPDRAIAPTAAVEVANRRGQ